MSGKLWTIEEKQQLEALYPNTFGVEIATLLGRKLAGIYHQANVLGLKKSETFLKELRPKSNPETQFKKGQKAWNAGKKGLQIGAIETQFKKGALAHNALQDGDIRTRRYPNGKTYQFIRIKEGHWELYHRWLWEKERGPIPPDQLVVFKDGDSKNCTIENLELLSNTENLQRNSLHQYPPEIKNAIIAINKLVKKANKLPTI